MSLKSKVIGLWIFLLFAGCSKETGTKPLITAEHPLHEKIILELQERTIEKADRYLEKEPVTVTSSIAEHSAGGPNDYFSEGDYWWPNPDDPDGPFVKRDGERYPGIFDDHRFALIRFAEITAAVTSAWILTGEQKYADHALEHMKAWFTKPETMMNPHMLYSQAITGRFTGRGIGLIDAYHLIEVAQSARVLSMTNAMPDVQAQRIKNWFGRFVTWMTTHKYGLDEMVQPNNHSTVWAVTAASMARLIEHDEIMELCRNHFKYNLLPEQMDSDGKFSLEIRRTKPYGYSLFNMDAFANLAHILSTPDENLWEYVTHDGKSLQLGLDFITPYIEDKSAWPYDEDIYIWEKWPVRHSLLLFSGLTFKNSEYIDLFLKQTSEPKNKEVLRNHPVRHPIIWMEDIF